GGAPSRRRGGAARAREPYLPERRVRRRGARHRAPDRAWTAGELPLHEGEREYRGDGRLPHAPGPRGDHASALRPDRRPPRGRGGLSREARAAVPGKVNGENRSIPRPRRPILVPARRRIPLRAGRGTERSARLDVVDGPVRRARDLLARHLALGERTFL